MNGFEYMQKLLDALLEQEDNEIAAMIAVLEVQAIIDNGLNKQDESTKETKQ